MGYQQYIHRAQVEIVVKRQAGYSLVGGMDTGVQHHSLASVLDDVTGSADFTTAAETYERKHAIFVNHFFDRRVCFPFCRHLGRFSTRQKPQRKRVATLADVKL